MPGKQLTDLFLKQSNDLIWMVDADLLLTYANQAYLKVMKQVTGKEKKLHESVLTEGFGEGYIEKWTAYYKRALSGEQFELEEHYAHPQTNEIQYGQIIFNPIRDENNLVMSVACQSRDITRIVKQRSDAHQLMDASLDVFCTINEAGNFVFVSEAATKHWGYTPQELLGKPYVSFIIEEDISVTSNIAEAILSGEEIKSFVNRYKRKDGAIAYNQWSARWDKEAKLMYCVARDAEEKIEQEKLLHQSEQRFRSLVQDGADMISIIDAAGNYMYTSPTTTAILGITPEEFDGHSVFDFIHPDDFERSAGYLQRISTESKVIVEPFRLRDGNKEWRWIETVLTNMLDNPAVKGIVANSRDITAKKKETQHLRLLESVITNTNDAVLITEAEPLDKPGPRILYVNEAFTRMTGYTAEEVIGTSPRILQGPNSDKAELARMGKALRNWETCEITTINYKKNGEEFWINFSVSPVADETGWYTHWIAIERDVTEQKTKELENELITQISSTFNLVSDFEKATNKLCEIIGLYGKLDWVELWTPNLEMTEMRLIGHYVIAPEDEIFYTDNHNHNKFTKDEGLIGKVWASGKQLLWDDVTKSKEFIRADSAKKIGLKSVMGIPLIFNKVVLGVLTVGVKSNSGHLKNYTQIFERLEKFIGSELQRKTLEVELGLLFDTIPDIISVGDFQGRFLRMNKPGCELLGYDEEEILQKGFEEFIHPEDLTICYEEIQQLQNGKDTFGFEVRFITKSGEILWLSWYCKAKINEGLIYCSAKNITEEKKLRELNRQANKLAKVGSWEYDLIKGDLFWSPEVYHLHDMDPGTFVPNVETAIDFYKEEHKSYVADEIYKSLTEGVYLDYEAVIISRSKKEKWVRVIGSPEFIDGKCVKFIGYFQDTTEHREAEIRLQSLSANLPGVVFQYIIYPDGTDKLLHVTTGAELIWGFSAEEAMQNNQQIWKQLEKGGDFEAHKKSIGISIQTKSLWKNKYRYVLPNNEIRTHLGYGSPTFLADGTIVFDSVILDITEEAKNEELLKQTSKIARVGSWEVDVINSSLFWSDITHEIHETPENFKPQLSEAINFYREDFRELVTEAVTACIETGTPFDFEAIVVTSKNNEVWVRSMGRAELVDGKTARIFGSFQDINERKIAEQQKNSLLTTLQKSLNEIYVFEAETLKFSYVNQAALLNLGYSEQEIKTLTPLDLKPEFTATTFNQLVNPLVTKEKEKIIFFTNHKRKNGSLYPVEVHLQLVEEGNNKRFLAVILDITDLKETEQLLATASKLARVGSWELSLQDNEEFKMFWSSMTKSILEIDESFEPTLANGLNVYKEPSRTLIETAVNNAIETGEAFDLELEIVSGKGNDVWIRCIGDAQVENGKVTRIYGSFQDINTRKLAELNQLKLSEEKSKILESIGDAFFAVDKNWVVTYWNQSAESVLGKKKEDIVGKFLWEEYADAINTDFYTKYHLAMETMETQSFEAFYETTNQWIEVTAYPSEDGLSVYFKDITQRKITNAEIAKSEEKRRLIMNGALDAIITIDTNETISFWNPQAEVVFGWKAEEVMGKPLSETIIPEPFRKYHVEGLKNYLQTGEGKALNVLLELSAIKRNGGEFPIELTVIPIKQGGEEFFCAFVRDITQRKKAEADRLMAEKNYQELFDKSNDAIYVHDLDTGQISDVNYRATELLGFDKMDFLEKDPFILFTDNPEYSSEKALGYVQRAAQGKPQVFEWLAKKKDGTSGWFEMTLKRTSIAGVDKILAFQRDIAERKKAERELLELNNILKTKLAELETAYEELEQFAYIASHDLQEPLRMISSFMDQLKRKYGGQLDDKAHEYIEFATDGAKRMKQIILDLLLYSRAGKILEEPQRIDVKKILDDYKILRRKVIAEKQVVFETGGFPIITTYNTPFIQVLHNLMDNAIKYAKNDESPLVKITCIDRNQFWEFCVEDNGIGIDEKFFSKIFVIFQRLHDRDKYSGTGIGLSIVKKQVDSLGGKIWIESKVHVGSKFYFTIPK